MSRQSNDKPSRREFLRGVGRAAGGAALAALAAGLVFGRRVAARRDECVGNGLCRGCAALADCRLPEGKAARVAHKGGRS